MLLTLKKTGTNFSSKGGVKVGCNFKISNRPSSLVIPHFEFLRGKNQPGVKRFYDHTVQNVLKFCNVHI